MYGRTMAWLGVMTYCSPLDGSDGWRRRSWCLETNAFRPPLLTLILTGTSGALSSSSLRTGSGNGSAVESSNDKPSGDILKETKTERPR